MDLAFTEHADGGNDQQSDGGTGKNKKNGGGDHALNHPESRNNLCHL